MDNDKQAIYWLLWISLCVCLHFFSRKKTLVSLSQTKMHDHRSYWTRKKQVAFYCTINLVCTSMAKKSNSCTGVLLLQARDCLRRHDLAWIFGPVSHSSGNGWVKVF
uniref:Uncharacterized protein n=1 Tax=Sphaerodactylus townsendi TaxID=933632 RepID=A0ACB8F4Q1_9SAUR